MVCADNYGTLVNEPSSHPFYIPFVVMVIVVGSMFLLSLLLGVTYDVFIEHTTDQVKSRAVVVYGWMSQEGEGEGKVEICARNLYLR